MPGATVGATLRAVSGVRPRFGDPALHAVRFRVRSKGPESLDARDARSDSPEPPMPPPAEPPDISDVLEEGDSPPLKQKTRTLCLGVPVRSKKGREVFSVI